MRTITAKFASKCHATGQAIKRGELIAYKLGQEPQESQEDGTRDYINAQEEAAIQNGNY